MIARHGRRIAPGVRTLVAAVALVPLVGVGVLSARTLQVTSAQATQVADLERDVGRGAELIGLHAELRTEWWWAYALAGVSGLGLPPETVEQLIGIDLAAELAGARDSVDRRLAMVVDDTLTDRVLTTRRVVDRSASEDTLVALDAAYRSIDEYLDARTRSGLRTIADVAASSPDAERLSRDIDVLATAAQMRSQVSTLTAALFGTRFASVASTVDRDRALVVALQAAYVDRLSELETLVRPGSTAAAALDALVRDDDVAEFMAQVDALSESIVSGGEAGNASSVVADPEAEAEAFYASIGAIDSHIRLVDAAAAQVSESAGSLAADLEQRQTLVVSLVVVIALATLLAVVAASRLIVRPLRRMGEVSDRMRGGDLGDRIEERGPREVRSAAAALNEATEHLELAERQALALAAEDLEAPVLQEGSTGALGESLHAAVSKLASSLAEREEFRRRLAHEASHDGLTGLANRSAVIADLASGMARGRRSGAALAVLYIDLDGFKPVNDRLGHEAGDRVLRAVAQRVVGAVREGDTVGRLGGDEFLVVAESVRDLDEAVGLARRVGEAIAVSIDVGSTELTITACIGVAFVADGSLTPDEIIRDADLAVYQAKSVGPASIEVCDEELRLQLQHRHSVERELREAIGTGGLQLFYQQITDAASGRPTGLEALVRWIQPDGRVVPPDEFIPVAERSDLIVELDRWVAGEAARQLSEWSQSPGLADLTVSVNVSARTLASPTFVGDVTGALERHGVDPRRLVIELTESALLEDLDRAASRLATLRARGVRVAIDDFGTGYTSLAHLRRLPVDVLKIDRSFVANLDRNDDRSLVKLIVETGHLLGVQVTAEGVETLEQADMLVALGSDHLQGYRFSRPAKASVVEAELGPEATADARAIDPSGVVG